jgi:hypothetical protein
MVSLREYDRVKEQYESVEYDRDYFMGREMQKAEERLEGCLNAIIDERIVELVQARALAANASLSGDEGFGG